MLAPSVYPSFVFPVMLDHLSHFQHSSLYPLLPLYDPEYGKSSVLNKFSIWHIIFEPFDYFQSSHDKCTGSYYFGSPTPQGHSSRRKFPLDAQTSKFYSWNVLDIWWATTATVHSFTWIFALSTAVSNSGQRFFYNRTSKLKAFVWPHILAAPTPSLPDKWSTHDLVSRMRLQPLWGQFHPTVFRTYFKQHCTTVHSFLIRNIQQFWRCHMYPQARTVYYRVFSR